VIKQGGGWFERSAWEKVPPARQVAAPSSGAGDDLPASGPTGILEIDAAFKYKHPIPFWIEYLEERWDRDGQEAVITDLEVAVDALESGTPAQTAMARWLAGARSGERPARR